MHNWSYTGLGYNVELRLGWDNFGFEPGRGRVMGWSLANDDNDYMQAGITRRFGMEPEITGTTQPI